MVLCTHEAGARVLDLSIVTMVPCTHEAGARVLDLSIVTMVPCTHEAGARVCNGFIDYYYGTVYSRGWRRAAGC